MDLQSYEEFVNETRVRTNHTLNRILWYFLVTGPAIAIGVWANAFRKIQYQSCFIITGIILVLAMTHRLLCKKCPDSKFTSFFALIALDFLLVYMTNAYVGIFLTYCLVPTLSLLYCDKKIFLVASGINYVAMCFGTWMIAPYYAEYSLLYPAPIDWLANVLGGYTIEAIIMFFAGSGLCKFATSHLRILYENQTELKKREAQISDQLDVLKSMSEIYQSLNLVDLEHKMVSAMNGPDKKEAISEETGFRSWSNRDLLNTVCFEYRDALAAFTDLQTIGERIKGKKNITLEVQDSVVGWLRCQYISLGENEDGVVDKVVYTIENVFEEKRREERLIRISNTDELTKLYNRRSYENDVKKYDAEALENNFVIFSVDINGLKEANDKFGHDAGDELILGAAECLLRVFGNIGKIYRVGGDEFVVLMHRFGDIPDLKQHLQRTAAKWCGKRAKSLNFSVGYACKYNNPSATYDVLEREADKMMYRDKEMFYSQRGMDRRGVQMAYGAVCNSYIKILRVNLEQNSFKLIRMDEAEKSAAMGYSEKFSEWLKKFGNQGFVHADDLQEYLRLTDVEFLKQYFASYENGEKTNCIKIFYRRKCGDQFAKTLMEIVAIEDNSENKEYFLYVKNIDE